MKCVGDPFWSGAVVFELRFPELRYYTGYIPIYIDVLLHHKAEQELIFCINEAEVHLKAIS